jgi:3-oxoacyl-[acyl-carrier-protein] synthase II
MGALTPLGNDVPTFWEGLKAGRSGIERISGFDPVRVASKVAGEIRDFDASTVMDRKEVRRNDRYIHYGWAATVEAMTDAGLPVPLTDDDLADRAGIIMGTGIGGINTVIRDVIEVQELGVERVGPFVITAMIGNMGSGFAAISGNLRGPNFATTSACASANHAIGEALTFIRRGDADIMVAGGAEAAIGEITVAAFSAMRALSTKRNDDPQHACRPFDADRDGFIMADGAGMLVLESLEHAQARGATIHAEVVGYGLSDDASHITLPAPGGRGAARSMQGALRDGGIGLGEVDYINAHGTSTGPNDSTETAAIKSVFGERAYAIPISSTKSMTGHLLGAGGAVEAIATIRTLQTGIIPPTINYEFPDPECDLDYVPNIAREVPVQTAISNSFGFGGHNATLAFRRWEGA